jgi:hypothetical protein
MLSANGLTDVRILDPGQGHPAVFGQWTGPRKADHSSLRPPRCPADRARNAVDNAALEPIVRNGRLYDGER